jgi:hypothetical protein
MTDVEGEEEPEETLPIWIYGCNGHLKDLVVEKPSEITGNLSEDFQRVCQQHEIIAHPLFLGFSSDLAITTRVLKERDNPDRDAGSKGSGGRGGEVDSLTLIPLNPKYLSARTTLFDTIQFAVLKQVVLKS